MEMTDIRSFVEACHSLRCHRSVRLSFRNYILIATLIIFSKFLIRSSKNIQSIFSLEITILCFRFIDVHKRQTIGERVSLTIDSELNHCDMYMMYFSLLLNKLPSLVISMHWILVLTLTYAKILYFRYHAHTFNCYLYPTAFALHDVKFLCQVRSNFNFNNFKTYVCFVRCLSL